MGGRIGFRKEEIEKYRKLQEMLKSTESKPGNPLATTASERMLDEADAQRPAHINPKHMRNQSDVQRDSLAPKNPALTGQRADGAPALVGTKRANQDYKDRPEDETEALQRKHASLEKSYEKSISLIEELRSNQQEKKATNLSDQVKEKYASLYEKATTEIETLRQKLITTHRDKSAGGQQECNALYTEAVGLIEKLIDNLKMAQTRDVSSDIPVTTKTSPVEAAQRPAVESSLTTDSNITQTKFSWEEYGSQFEREYAAFMREYADGLSVESGESRLMDKNSTQVFSIQDPVDETTQVI